VIREKAEIIAHDLEWEDLPMPQRRSTDRTGSQTSGFLLRHGVRIVGVALDLPAMFGLGFAGVLLGFSYWPSTAVFAVCYSILATAFLGRSFGLVAAEWIFRTLGTMRGARRLLSSRAQNA
jgi:hypothetical protein